MNETCAKCHSDKLIFDAMAVDRGDYNAEGNFSLAIDEKPAALIFKQRIRSNVSAVVCGDCGYIEFYAEHPDALYAAWLNRRENES
jgi:hypothetical protein